MGDDIEGKRCFCYYIAHLAQDLDEYEAINKIKDTSYGEILLKPEKMIGWQSSHSQLSNNDSSELSNIEENKSNGESPQTKYGLNET